MAPASSASARVVMPAWPTLTRSRSAASRNASSVWLAGYRRLSHASREIEDRGRRGRREHLHALLDREAADVGERHWKISVVQSPPWRRTSWACRRRAVEVDEEVRVELHPAGGVAVHAQQPRAQPGIELVVPGRVERVGDVEPAPVERELEHLRAAVEVAAAVATACRGRRRAGAARSGAGCAGSEMSYWRRSPCSQFEKYRKRSSIETTRSVIRPGDRERPALLLDAVDGDHLVGAVGAVVAVEVPHRARQRGADEALVGVGVVQPADLERHEAGLAELERLLDAALGSGSRSAGGCRSARRRRPRGRTRPRRRWARRTPTRRARSGAAGTRSRS